MRTSFLLDASMRYLSYLSYLSYFVFIPLFLFLIRNIYMDEIFLIELSANLLNQNRIATASVKQWSSV